MSGSGVNESSCIDLLRKLVSPEILVGVKGGLFVVAERQSSTLDFRSLFLLPDLDYPPFCSRLLPLLPLPDRLRLSVSNSLSEPFLFR